MDQTVKWINTILRLKPTGRLRSHVICPPSFSAPVMVPPTWTLSCSRGRATALLTSFPCTRHPRLMHLQVSLHAAQSHGNRGNGLARPQLFKMPPTSVPDVKPLGGSAQMLVNVSKYANVHTSLCVSSKVHSETKTLAPGQASTAKDK